MKQFIKNKKITYNLMSFTGYKGLVLFDILTESPKSYEEVCDYFKKHPYVRETISIDTLRVYINSFKLLGCEIKRTKGDDKISRYQIVSHPFELSMTEDEIQSVLKVFKTLNKNISVEEIFALHNFLEKIAALIKNDKFAEDINKVSIFKDINKKLIEDLIDCCKKKDQIVINYNSPNSGDKDIEIIADKLEISNNKVYLYGLGLEYNQYGSFLLARINKIQEIKLNRTIPDNLQEIKVVYELEGRPDYLEYYETILNDDDEKVLIEASISNTFLFKQKLLEYGPACKILEPQSFKEEFIELLKDMKAGYYCG